MKKLFLLTLAILSLAACQVEELVTGHEANDADIYASVETLNATKTSMDQYNNVLWSEGDQIVAFMKTTLGIRYQIKEQYVGSTTGGFSKVTGSEGGDDLESGQEIDHNVVVYPYSDQVWCMKYDDNTPANAYKLNVNLPEIQSYAKNSFADGAFPMIAVSSSNQLTFRNICGGIKLQLKGEDKIKSIKFEGLAGESLSGKSSVVAYADGSFPVITMESDALKSVILDCGDGVQLYPNSPTTFIIAVPPMEFRSGMKITVTDADGLSRTLINTSSNTVKRSSLLTFPVITYTQEGVFEIPEGTLTSYEIQAEGGTVEIPVVTNQEYEVVIPENAAEWITLAQTKALREETIVLNIAENTVPEERSAEVLINAGGETLLVINVNQDESSIVVDLSLDGTANCYVVKKPGIYKFPTVRGNSSTSVGSPVSAEILWESFGTSTIPNVGDLILSASYADGYVTFSTSKIFNNGNAVIAVKDFEGTILWSWHIWCASEGYKEHIYANNAGTMMDRNLGALSASPGDVGSLGLFYQWGRKDPFLGASSISGGGWTRHISAYGYTWGHRYSNSTTGTVEYATANPMLFISNTYTNGNNDWFYIPDYESNDFLWNPDKTEYDPCPPGWKVPDGYGTGVWATAGIVDTPYDSKNEGILFPASFCGEAAWYPAAGNRVGDTGSISDVGHNGYYWSNTVDSDGYPNYYFSFSYNGEVNSSAETGHQYIGRSVRCQKEHTGGGVSYPEDTQPIDLSLRGTANCYVVSKPGVYSIAAVKGNSSSSVGTPFRAKVIWETYGTDEIPKEGDIIRSVYYSDGRLVFSTPEELCEGNALVALLDASNDILWSWHIWCTSEGYGEQVYANGAGTMMDRNLGALSATPGDIGSLGLRYQWGRKDPFLSSSSFDEEIQPKSTNIWPEEIESSYSVGTIDYTNRHPTTYIKGTFKQISQNTYEGTNDWFYYSPMNSLWGSNKTIYDPCPVGWRVCDGGKNGVWAVAGFPSNRTHNKLDIYDSVKHGYIFDASICGSESWYPVMDGYSTYHSVTTSTETDIWKYCIYILSLSKYNTILPDEFGSRDSLYFVRCQKISQ